MMMGTLVTTTVQTGLHERPDALDGALKVLRGDVRDVSYKEGEALARFHKGEWIVGKL